MSKYDDELAYNQLVNGFIVTVQQLGDGERVDMTNPEQVANRVMAYFETAYKFRMKTSVVGVAVALGISRQEFNDYRAGKIGRSPDVRTILNQTLTMLEMAHDLNVQFNKINPVSGIFLYKSNFGYTETDNAQRDTAPLEVGTAQEKINQRYLESVVSGRVEGAEKQQDKKGKGSKQAKNGS